jgi:hypothetical protein
MTVQDIIIIPARIELGAISHYRIIQHTEELNTLRRFFAIAPTVEEGEID